MGKKKLKKSKSGKRSNVVCKFEVNAYEKYLESLRFQAELCEHSIAKCEEVIRHCDETIGILNDERATNERKCKIIEDELQRVCGFIEDAKKGLKAVSNGEDEDVEIWRIRD